MSATRPRRQSAYMEHPLRLATWDGHDSPYHPSVLHFARGWQGHRWWMVQTPYGQSGQPYRDRWECPQIHVSDDGVHWTSPVPGPIDDLTPDEIATRDYLSDPHLVAGPDGRLEVWYRHTRRHGNLLDTSDVSLVRKRSADGRRWGEREYLGKPSAMVVSPAVIWDGAEGYRMWYVVSERKGEGAIACASSPDGRAWTEPVPVRLEGPEGIIPWHIDVTRDPASGLYYLTVYDHADITLWQSDDARRFTYVKTLLRCHGRRGSFYYELYRAALVSGDGAWHLYFSASDRSHTYIGLMRGASPQELTVYNPRGTERFRSPRQTLMQETLPQARMALAFRLRRLKERLFKPTH